MRKLRCPKCDGKPELDRISFKLTDVDQCPKCEGVWFDHSAPELTTILETGRDNVPQELKDALECDAGRVVLEPDKANPWKCPRCGIRLRTYWYASEIGKSFKIEGCPAGCGVWLDDGELSKANEFLRDLRKPMPTKEKSTGILDRVELLRQAEGDK